MKDYLKSQTIYQVYVRNFSKEGTFKKVIEKLDYIKDLGTDILYLLPIHEIGVVNHKGSLGCPYSVKDYYSIAPELGTLEDFKLLIEETHKKGMKIMMDIVFNHTSRDSVLLNTHPEWFFLFLKRHHHRFKHLKKFNCTPLPLKQCNTKIYMFLKTILCGLFPIAAPIPFPLLRIIYSIFRKLSSIKSAIKVLAFNKKEPHKSCLIKRILSFA